MARAAFVVALVAASAAPVPAADLAVTVVERGIYRAETRQAIKESSAPGGVVNLISDPILVRSGDRVPAVLGTSFGIEFAVEGPPRGTQVELLGVIRFPAPGMKNPDTGRTHASASVPMQLRSGATGFHLYGFDSAWEMIPGQWRFEIWSGKRKLAEQVLTIGMP